jgi:hypothetical protein
MARAADGRHVLPPLGTAGEAASTAKPLATTRTSRVATARRNHNDAQRAPSAQPAFTVYLRECAQSGRVLIVKSGVFLVDFDEGDGLKNRCRFERKI